jgi:hypothetical protein
MAVADIIIPTNKDTTETGGTTTTTSENTHDSTKHIPLDAFVIPSRQQKKIQREARKQERRQQFSPGTVTKPYAESSEGLSPTADDGRQRPHYIHNNPSGRAFIAETQSSKQRQSQIGARRQAAHHMQRYNDTQDTYTTVRQHIAKTTQASILHTYRRKRQERDKDRTELGQEKGVSLNIRSRSFPHLSLPE